MTMSANSRAFARVIKGNFSVNFRVSSSASAPWSTILQTNSAARISRSPVLLTGTPAWRRAARSSFRLSVERAPAGPALAELRGAERDDVTGW